MKKRILSAILVSALVLSMAGCSGETPTSEPVSQQSQTSTSENKGQSSTTSEAVSSESTSTSSNSESTPSASSSSASKPSSSSSSSSSSTSTKPVVPTNQPSIVSSYDYLNGGNTWVFQTSDKQNYAYNLAEKKIYKLDKMTDINLILTMGQLVYYKDFSGYNTYIQNASTQQTVLPRSEGYRIEGFYWALDRILVSKLEKSFSGNKFLVGVMNSKMEWVYPLTEISIDGFSEYDYLDCVYTLLGDKMMIYGRSFVSQERPPYIYSFKNKCITPVSTDDWQDGYWYWSNTSDQILVSFYGRDGFWYFDSSSENGIFNDKYGGLWGYSPNGNIVSKNVNKCYVLDSKTMKELAVFDLSAYNVRSIIDVTKDRILFEALNPDGDTYTIIMNKDGSLVTEPILSSSYDSDIISICDDCAIMSSHTIVNCKTGKTTKVDYEIKQVYNAYGMMVVGNSEGLYLVKPSEPNKLLSPFAIGQRV